MSEGGLEERGGEMRIPDEDDLGGTVKRRRIDFKKPLADGEREVTQVRGYPYTIRATSREHGSTSRREGVASAGEVRPRNDAQPKDDAGPKGDDEIKEGHVRKDVDKIDDEIEMDAQASGGDARISAEDRMSLKRSGHGDCETSGQAEVQTSGEDDIDTSRQERDTQSYRTLVLGNDCETSHGGHKTNGQMLPQEGGFTTDGQISSQEGGLNVQMSSQKGGSPADAATPHSKSGPPVHSAYEAPHSPKSSNPQGPGADPAREGEGDSTSSGSLANQSVPGGERAETMRLYFHAVLSRDFGPFDDGRDRVVLRSADLCREDVMQLHVTGSIEDFGLLVDGVMEVSVSAVHNRRIAYRYALLRGDAETPEFICKADGARVGRLNRSMQVWDQCIQRKEDWHQYDDLIRAPPAGGIAGWLRSAADKAKVARDMEMGKRISGRVHLERILGFVQGWTRPGLDEFHSLVEQLAVCYSEEWVHEGHHRPWHGLDFGPPQVDKLVSELVVRILRPHSEFRSDPSCRPSVASREQSALLAASLLHLRDVPVPAEWLSIACRLLAPLPPRASCIEQSRASVQATCAKLRIHPRPVAVLVGLCARCIAAGVVDWLLTLPVLHLLRGHVEPFGPVVKEEEEEQQEDIWAGLEGIPYVDTRNHIRQDEEGKRRLVELLVEHSFLLDMDRLLARSVLCVMPSSGVAAIVDVLPLVPLDVVRAACYRLRVFSCRRPTKAEEQVHSRSHFGGPWAPRFGGPALWGPWALHFWGPSAMCEHRGARELWLAVQSPELGGDGVAVLEQSTRAVELTCAVVHTSAELLLGGLRLLRASVDAAGLESASRPQMQDGSGGPTADPQGPVGEQAVRACREALERVALCIAALRPDRLLVPHGTNAALQEPLEIWSAFLGIQFSDADLQRLWVRQLLSHARGRITQEEPQQQLDVFLRARRKGATLHPVLYDCLESAALDAVWSICQNKEEELAEKELQKCSKVLSRILVEAWPKRDGQASTEHVEVVLHLLGWRLSARLLKMHG
ncbi:E3 ubiquitin-protein ligase rnf213-alpha-like [Lethenteron reissneri]|uniref:E3 ubiquitin-protein ligase rnf213-alpha-like n=1 Tax=Lethenteron reissneri TaxID=7753 RepID=UPI002AB79C8C|nr:E3 ubiquitin-protein ligase rnf213-alpha-like [Lethenteron reissneri]